MKKAIITFIIIELCLIIALSAQKITESFTTDVFQTIADIQIPLTKTNETEATQTPETTQSPTKEPVADNTSSIDDPIQALISVTVPQWLMGEDVDSLVTQARGLEIDTAILEDGSLQYSMTPYQQTQIIDNTKIYIDDTLSRIASADSDKIEGILYNELYTMLTIVVDSEIYDVQNDGKSVELYFVLMHLFSGSQLDEIDLSISLQDRSTNDIFREYDFVNDILR